MGCEAESGTMLRVAFPVVERGLTGMAGGVDPSLIVALCCCVLLVVCVSGFQQLNAPQTQTDSWTLFLFSTLSSRLCGLALRSLVQQARACVPACRLVALSIEEGRPARLRRCCCVSRVSFVIVPQRRNAEEDKDKDARTNQKMKIKRPKNPDKGQTKRKAQSRRQTLSTFLHHHHHRYRGTKKTMKMKMDQKEKKTSERRKKRRC